MTASYIRRRDGSFTYDVAGHSGEARVFRSEGDWIELEVDGIQQMLSVVTDGLRHWVQSTNGEIALVEIPRFPEPEPEKVAGGYTAHMPGRIVAVNVEEGQQVSAGQVLVILEAMKMEHLITCAEDGAVNQVRITAGQQVEAGDVLLVVDTGGGEA